MGVMAFVRAEESQLPSGPLERLYPPAAPRVRSPALKHRPFYSHSLLICEGRKGRCPFDLAAVT